MAIENEVRSTLIRESRYWEDRCKTSEEENTRLRAECDKLKEEQADMAQYAIKLGELKTYMNNEIKSLRAELAELVEAGRRMRSEQRMAGTRKYGVMTAIRLEQAFDAILEKHQ